jgi:hypothetical protein
MPVIEVYKEPLDKISEKLSQSKMLDKKFDKLVKFKDKEFVLKSSQSIYSSMFIKDNNSFKPFIIQDENMSNKLSERNLSADSRKRQKSSERGINYVTAEEIHSALLPLFSDGCSDRSLSSYGRLNSAKRSYDFSPFSKPLYSIPSRNNLQDTSLCFDTKKNIFSPLGYSSRQNFVVSSPPPNFNQNSPNQNWKNVNDEYFCKRSAADMYFFRHKILIVFFQISRIGFVDEVVYFTYFITSNYYRPTAGE